MARPRKQTYTMAQYIKRYNEHKAMNANQKMFVYLPAFAEKIRDISKRNFFINNCVINDNEKDKGMLERVISETVMNMFHFEKWNKNGKKIATYLNENAKEEEFDILNNNIERLESIVTDDTKALFNSKDCFIWFTLFNKFTQYGLNDDKFGEFLSVFVSGLKDKPVNGKLFYNADTTGSTKDKSVIIDKLHILETLMKEYLHISEPETKVLSKEEFISQNVEIPIEDVKQDIDAYEETLKELEDNTIRDGSKLLNEENHLSLLAMVAYSYKHDIDLDEWLEDYAAKNNTYFVDQKKNFCFMVKDLKQYMNRKDMEVA